MNRQLFSCGLLCLAMVVCLLILAGCRQQESVDWQPNPPLDLHVELSQTQVPLLQELTLRLYLYADKDLDVKFTPQVPVGFSGDLAQVWQPFGDGRMQVSTMQLRPLDFGTLVIPDFEVTVGDRTVTTDALQVQVVSVLAKDADVQAAEAPAPPFPARSYFWLSILLILFSQMVLAVIILFLRRRNLRAVRNVLVVRPAHQRALRALQQLRDLPLETTAQVEQFYVQVSQILRFYLEERFALRAPEWTTEEFLLAAQSNDNLDAQQRLHLQEFLQRCDLVKFAAVLPEAQAHEETFKTAEDFIQQTREDQQPADPTKAKEAVA